MRSRDIKFRALIFPRKPISPRWRLITSRWLVTSLIFTICKISSAGFLEQKVSKDAVIAVINQKLLRIDRRGEFKVYFINKYDFGLTNLRLEAQSEVFEARISPLVIDKLVPETPDSFLVKLKLKDNYPAGNYRLDLSLLAAQGEEFKQGLKEPALIRDEEQKTTVQTLQGKREGERVIFPLGEFSINVDEMLGLKTVLYFGIIISLTLFIIIRAKYSR